MGLGPVQDTPGIRGKTLLAGSAGHHLANEVAESWSGPLSLIATVGKQTARIAAWRRTAPNHLDFRPFSPIGYWDRTPSVETITRKGGNPSAVGVIDVEVLSLCPSEVAIAFWPAPMTA
jgi:hypothetical protein